MKIRRLVWPAMKFYLAVKRFVFETKASLILTNTPFEGLPVPTPQDIKGFFNISKCHKTKLTLKTPFCPVPKGFLSKAYPFDYLMW